MLIIKNKYRITAIIFAITTGLLKSSDPGNHLIKPKPLNYETVFTYNALHNEQSSDSIWSSDCKAYNSLHCENSNNPQPDHQFKPGNIHIKNTNHNNYYSIKIKL